MEKRKILIVDDEALFLSSLEDHLSLAYPEIQVETATDGVQALRILEAGGIDLVATDVRMPHLDGLELLASIVSVGLKIPVIVFSAFVDTSVEEQAEMGGAFAVFDKPVELDRLCKAIQSALRGVEAGQLRGISIAGFLQLLQMERKSCRLNVKSGEEEALLYFHEGELVHARWGDLEGDGAAQAIVRWDPVEINMQGGRWLRPRTVEMSLTHLLLASAKAEDEGDEIPGPVEEDQARGTLFAFSSSRESEGSPSIGELAASDAVQEVLGELTSLQGFLGAALLRADDHRRWTLGSFPAQDLEIALGHCASALEAEEALLAKLGSATGPRWQLSMILSRHFYLARRLGPKGALLVVLNRNMATLATAIRELAALCERLEPPFLREPRHNDSSSLRLVAPMGRRAGEAF